MAPVRTLSFPMRLTRTGAMASVEQDSDAHIEELIAAAVLTQPGERPHVPSFGVADPAFAGWERLRLSLHLQDYGPHVVCEDVSIVRNGDGQESVTLAWRYPETWETRR